MDLQPLRGVSPLRLTAGLILAAAVWVGGPARLSPYSSLALAYLLAVVGARPFVRGFQRSLVTGRADADMLVIFGVWAALAQATMAVFVPDLLLAGARRPFFEVLGALVVFPAIGRRLEELLTERGGEALWTLARRIPRSVRLVGGGLESMVSVAGAAAGSRFRVLPGEHIPLDGSVVEGRSRVDESLWTGRGAAIEKSAGSRVLGGSLNKTGVLTVAAEGPAAEMRLTRIVETVRAGVHAKAAIPGVADQLASSYAPGVLIVAVVAALAWSWKGPEPRLERALTTLAHVLVAACPWTFVLAVPAALAAGMRRARQMGLQVRNPAVLQVLRAPDVVVLSDPLRPAAAEEVSALARIGVSVILVSGDREAAVRAAAEAVGIEKFFAEVLEEDKLRIVTELQAAGTRVAMVGEGFNDAPALSRADLGIALGPAEAPHRPGAERDLSGFDLAAESADIVLGRRDLASLLDALRLLGRIRAVVRENLTLVFLPQLVLLPLAAGVFGPSFGVLFQPSYAAVAAAVSAVAIAVNSIRRLRL